MTANHEPSDTTQDSEAFVESVLADNFEIKQNKFSDTQVITFLAKRIEELPAETVKVISLIGGAASGKSTFTRSVIGELAKAGIAADSIGTDDYNRGDRAWRWEHFEGDDPEDPIGKYDFDLLNRNIELIKQNISDKPVVVPTYDQTTGLAIDAGKENYTHKVGKVNVLFVEGDFHPVEAPDLVIYLHVPDVVRLQNRISRDLELRGGDDPEKITGSFNFRQHRQHIPYTIPAIESADFVLRVIPVEGSWTYDVFQRAE